MQYTTAQRIELGGPLSLDTAGEEVCLVNVGRADISYRCSRTNGALSPKDMLYLPRKSTVELDGSGATLVRFGAPAERDTALVRLPFAQMDKDPRVHRVFGKAEINCQRDAWLCLDQNVDADRLMVLTDSAGLSVSKGTVLALHTARRLGKPHIVIDIEAPDARARARAFLEVEARGTLCVAGPRESEAPGIYAKARTFLEGVLAP